MTTAVAPETLPDGHPVPQPDGQVQAPFAPEAGMMPGGPGQVPVVEGMPGGAPELPDALQAQMPAAEAPPGADISLEQALNNMAVIHHHLGSLAEEKGDHDLADRHFDQAADLWTKAIRLAPNNYIEAQNWLKTSGRGSVDVYF